MWAIGLPRRFAGARIPERLLRRHGLEVGWIAFAVANYAAALIWQGWEVLPFRIVWIVLIVAYGLLVLREDRLLTVVFLLAAVAAGAMLLDVLHMVRLWNSPVDVPPVMALICLVMVWNARRHQQALRQATGLAEVQHSLLERQERFMHDASHELRTPLTIARGHLELLRDRGPSSPDLEVALDELSRLDGIIERLLLLAAADQPDFLRREELALEPFLEDLFVRWTDLAPRLWRLGPAPQGVLYADPERLRTALDSLLENAVKYSAAHDAIELRARRSGEGGLVIEVADEGRGIPAEALSRIFERFGRADAARGRSAGGVGLGLAIVDAIAKGHGGRCTVQSSSLGSVFALELPGFVPQSPPGPRAGEPGPGRSQEIIRTS
jgi:signal transduction histidine kinase